MSSKDKERITLTCRDCGKSFTLSYGRYRRLGADNHWRCKDCNNVKRSQIFANLTDSERKSLTIQRSTAAKSVWNNLSVDEYVRRCKSQQERWARLTPEKRAELMSAMHKAHCEYLKRPEIRAMISARSKQRWDSLSENEREKELLRLAKIRDEYWSSLTDEEKSLKMLKMWVKQINVGPTEFTFNTFLKDIGMTNGIDYFWGYNTFPYIHPQFYGLFGHINPVTKEMNIPYHTWDFILFPSDKNPIVVDIDGSVHDPAYMHFIRSGNSYTERQKIDYNDSKRPYQIPDTMNAYIIKAYIDKIIMSTPVDDISNGISMKFLEFRDMIIDRFHPSKSIK